MDRLGGKGKGNTRLARHDTKRQGKDDNEDIDQGPHEQERKDITSNGELKQQRR